MWHTLSPCVVFIERVCNIIKKSPQRTVKRMKVYSDAMVTIKTTILTFTSVH